MLRRRTVAVDYCLNRAAECEKLAELAPERSVRTRYRQLAATWLRLARNTEFTEKLDARLAGEKPE
jgi:hypothetical protein